jgi:hypothetical protein
MCKKNIIYYEIKFFVLSVLTEILATVKSDKGLLTLFLLFITFQYLKVGVFGCNHIRF